MKTYLKLYGNVWERFLIFKFCNSTKIISEYFDCHFCFRSFVLIFVNLKKKVNGERFWLDLIFVFMLYLNYCVGDWLYWDRRTINGPVILGQRNCFQWDRGQTVWF